MRRVLQKFPRHVGARSKRTHLVARLELCFGKQRDTYNAHSVLVIYPSLLSLPPQEKADAEGMQ